MIERVIVKQKIKELQVKEYLEAQLFGAGYSSAEIKRTPLGEKIIVYTSRPGMVVGRSGKNIKDLTDALKTKFNLENPQIEITEIKNTSLDAGIMAEKISISLARFGQNRFKNIIHKASEEIIRAGAKGCEILCSGKVPSARARRWRVSQGYLKKCGDPALMNVEIAYKTAKLKSGIIGIIVKIMPPDVILPDHIFLKSDEQMQKEKTAADASAIAKEEKLALEKPKEKKPRKKKTAQDKTEIENKATEAIQEKVEVKPELIAPQPKVLETPQETAEEKVKKPRKKKEDDQEL